MSGSEARRTPVCLRSCVEIVDAQPDDASGLAQRTPCLLDLDHVAGSAVAGEDEFPAAPDACRPAARGSRSGADAPERKRHLMMLCCLVELGGFDQVPSVRSTSAHLMPSTSPRRAPVSSNSLKTLATASGCSAKALVSRASSSAER